MNLLYDLQEVEKCGLNYLVYFKQDMNKAFIFDKSGVLLRIVYGIFNSAEEAVEEYLNGGSYDQSNY
jgi:hypothetical protein